MNGMRKKLTILGIAVALVAPQPVHATAVAQQQSADQYEMGRQALNRSQYARAVDLFRQYRESSPAATYVPESLYWEAYALSRMESSAELRAALDALEMQRSRYPNASTAEDAKALLASVRGELARRGDSGSAEWVYRNTVEQDRERERRGQSQDAASDDAKLAALNALMQMDSDAAVPLLRRIVKNYDNNPELRVHALFILAQQEEASVTDLMLDAARNDPDREVRQQAVFWLSQNDSPETVQVLRSILENQDDAELHEQAVFALSQMSQASAADLLRRYAESANADPDVRANAVFWIAQHSSSENVRFLRELFARIDDNRTREAILFGLSQMEGQGNAQWLMDIAMNTSESSQLRTQALFMASQMDVVAISDLVGVYDRATDRELKTQALFILSQREDPKAFDKLLDVVKNESDSEIRQTAIFWLGQSGDPRAEQALIAILEE